MDARVALGAARHARALPGGEPAQAAYRDYRRWAFESAALDLALRQGGRSLGDALGREPRPLRFVSSTRAPRSTPWLELYPELRFKLDPTPDWTDELIATLAARGNVDVVDLKGAVPRHRRRQPGRPGALPARRGRRSRTRGSRTRRSTPETDAVLAPHRDRVTWDAPIHSWADVEALPFPPRCLNCKPSRFGSLERLFEFYDRCAEHGIALYGGGQFELGVGRGQIQLLAVALPRRTARTTSRPAATTSPSRGRASRRARSTRSAEPTGFRRVD